MPVRYAKQDAELLKLGASFMLLRTSDICDLTGRTLRRVQRRMRKLRLDDNGGLGLFYDDLRNPANPFEKVHRLTQKGWDEAQRRGLINQDVNANREKSEGQLEHDLVLTDFHKALHFAFGDRLKWSQLYEQRYQRFGKGRDEYVNADAFFVIDDKAFFVEIENQKGVEEPLRKMRNYTAFASYFSDYYPYKDFRVVILKPTSAMAAHVLSAAREDKETNTRRFWITDYESAKHPTEQAFKTPRDFETESYSLATI
jgi:hypothetical protein